MATLFILLRSSLASSEYPVFLNKGTPPPSSWSRSPSYFVRLQHHLNKGARSHSAAMYFIFDFYPLGRFCSAEMWVRSQGLSPHRNTQPPPPPLHPPVGNSLVSLCDLSHAHTNLLRVSSIERADKGSGGPCAAVHPPVKPFHLPFTIAPSHTSRSRPCTHPAQPLQFALISLQEIHPPPPPPLAHLPSCQYSKPSALRSTSPSPLPSPDCRSRRSAA